MSERRQPPPLKMREAMLVRFVVQILGQGQPKKKNGERRKETKLRKM